MFIHAVNRWLTCVFFLANSAHGWQAHQGAVTVLKYSPDATQILSGGDDGYARVWAPTGKLLAEFRHDSGFRVFDSVFLPGDRVLSCSHDGSTYVWNSKNGERIAQLKGHSTYVARVTVNPARTKLYTLGTDDWIIERDVDTLQESGRFKTKSPVGLVFLQEDGHDRIVTAGLEGLDVWAADAKGEWKFLRKLRDTWFFFSLSVTPDNRIFAAGAVGEGIRPQLILPNGQSAREFLGTTQSAWQTDVSRDGRFVGVTSYYGATHIWDSRGGAVLYSSEGKLSGTNALVFVPGRQEVLVGGSDGKIHTAGF